MSTSDDCRCGGVGCAECVPGHGPSRVECDGELKSLRKALWAAAVFAEDIREWAEPSHEFTWEDGFKESVCERAASVAIVARAALAKTRGGK